MMQIKAVHDLDIVKAYLSTGGLFVYLGRGKSGGLYLCLAIDPLDWYFVEVTPQRLDLIESGDLCLRCAYTDPEAGFVMHIREGIKKNNVIRVPLNEIRHDWLPLEGTRI